MAERRLSIAERIAALRAELDVLVAEAAELDVAERVLKRFSDSASIGGSLEKTPEAQNGAAPEEVESPTLPKMVFMILEEAKAKGQKGVEGSEIVSIIKARWKPNFTAENVRPTLWRMVKKEGRLKKRGKIYSMPPSSPEGETEAVGASARH